ncbi:MAG TPA: biotin carboxylase, partial [Micromonospora sp.]
MTGVVLVAGFIRPVLKAMGEFQADGSVIVVDEPDVARKRDLAGAIADLPSIRELVEWEYQLPGAADTFFHRHRDLDVVAVVPVQEYAVPFAARLAERYGVPGATSGAAAILRDKHLLRVVTAAAGIANPVSEPVDDPDQVRDFARRHPGPLILKPANRQAAVG